MHWQPNPGATLNSQILAEACACAEGLGGAKDGRWRTAMTFYRPMPRDSSAPPADVPRDFLGLALHDRPDTYFFILRAHRLVLHADASIQAIMEKLQSYKARVVFNFEVWIPLSFFFMFLLGVFDRFGGVGGVIASKSVLDPIGL